MTVGARETLLRGLTTVRDIGGPIFGMKKAIDEGIVPGRGIFTAGPAISQTSGHGDQSRVFDAARMFDGPPSRQDALGGVIIADGVPQVLAAVRQALKQGATQIKVLAGGGVSSPYDPLDVNQFTFDELKAAVEAASDWGTYVTVHVYNSFGIQRAIAAGQSRSK
jgi:imidazolonepropionase-like amidohydrolase